jgi:hypothetical protein
MWKFLAARSDNRICIQSQIESAWPVFGSIMPDTGGIVFAAGRQSAVGGGIRFYKLNPMSGEIIWQTSIWSDPDSLLKLEDQDLIRKRTRNQRVNDLLVHNGKNVCLWITPLKSEYAPNEKVDIEHSVVSARAMKFSIPSKEELRETSDATWIWSATSAGFLSRRIESVGRHDTRGVNYAQINAVKICLAGNQLYALEATGGKSKELRGGLMRVTLNDDGTVPDKPDWSGKGPGNGVNRAMIVAGDRIYISEHRHREKTSTLHVHSTKDGSPIAKISLPSRPIRDGLAAAYGKLYVACEDGSVICLGAPGSQTPR